MIGMLTLSVILYLTNCVEQKTPVDHKIILRSCKYYSYTRCRTVDQVVSRRRVTVEARAQFKAIPYGICGGLSGSGTGFFLRILWLSSVTIIPAVFDADSFITDAI
jgi:hypothetical protein